MTRNPATITPEHVLQRRIVAALRRRGYIVAVIGTRARGPRGFSFATPGTPDLFVTRPMFGYWVGIEIKRPAGRIRHAQQRLLDARAISIAYTLPDVLAALRQSNL